MKKIIVILSIILVFSLSGCAEETKEEVALDITVEDVVEEEVPEIQEETSLEEEVLQAEEDTEYAAPSVEIQQTQGEASYQGKTLTYSIGTPVLENFPAESAEIITNYYESLENKYVNYLEQEAVFQLAELQWDGEYAYNFGCQMTYLSENMVGFLRMVTEPGQEFYVYSETFALGNGGLVTLDYLFGLEESEYRDVILDYVIQDISNNDELLPQINQRDEDWITTLSNQLDLNQFYLSETGLLIYFQHNQLGIGTGFSVEIPWENLPEAIK